MEGLFIFLIGSNKKACFREHLLNIHHDEAFVVDFPIILLIRLKLWGYVTLKQVSEWLYVTL